MPSGHTIFLGLLLLLVSTGSRADIPTAPREEKFEAGKALTLAVALDTAGFLNGGYPIDSAGYVDLPVVGKILVDGKTQSEVETFLAARLANYLKDVNIKATPCIRLTLLGHFTRQGQYYVSPAATVWEAVYLAGGIAGERSLDRIKVFRGGQEVPISFLDEYSRERTLVAAGIHSGDIVVVPVPRDNQGFWYYFRETISTTSGLISLVGGIFSIYLTYVLIQDGSLRRP